MLEKSLNSTLAEFRMIEGVPDRFYEPKPLAFKYRMEVDGLLKIKFNQKCYVSRKMESYVQEMKAKHDSSGRSLSR